MAHADHTRDPWKVFICPRVRRPLTSNTSRSPWVVLNDFGGAFSMGAVGGGIWYGIKGARNSPRVRLPYTFEP
jgi:mitochondrial import inner membrane translocase subunit TIM17